MKNEIDVKFILSVYEKIHEHGEAKDGVHELEGVKGFTSHDGYTVFLENHEVKCSTGFHNTYHLDYDSQRAFDNFMKKLKYIDKTYD